MKRKQKLQKLYSIKQDISLLKKIISNQIDYYTEYRFDVPVNGKVKQKVKSRF